MKPAVSLVRDASGRSLPPSVFVRERAHRGGQLARYRLSIRTRSDVVAARRANFAVSLLEPQVIEALGYPLRFKPRLLVSAEEAPSLIKTRYQPLVFRDENAARNPKLEDIVVAMLSIDPLGARRIAVENRFQLDPARLLKRVLQENAEEAAYRVRLDDFAPGLPSVPKVCPLSRTALASENRRPFAQRT